MYSDLITIVTADTAGLILYSISTLPVQQSESHLFGHIGLVGR